MPSVSPAQHRLMEAAAHTAGGYGGVPRRVGEEYVAAEDAGSVRSVDQDGNLHVRVTNISKANICPYLGHEIPGWQGLGLNPDRIYQLFRDPAELERGAHTFNNLRILSEHVPVTAEDPKPELVVGSTGTEAVFDAPYLRNSLVIWTQPAIDGIVNKDQHELSCGYYYDPDMTPGEFMGEKYDGVMRNIRGNHVALVKIGRAGSDVVVGDQQMTGSRLSRKAVLARGAIAATVRPMLANDAAIDFRSLLGNFGTRGGPSWQAVKDAAVKAIKPKLAADADIRNVVKALDMLDADMDGKPPAEDDDLMDDGDDDVATDEFEPVRERMRREGMSEDSIEECIGMMLPTRKITGDAPPPTPETPAPPEPSGKRPKLTSAMDTGRLIADAEARVVRRMNDLAEAREAVRPFVGAVALDSAEAVYALALKSAGVDTTGVHPSAYRAMVGMLPDPASRPAPRVALDAAALSAFDKQFPGASRIRLM